MTLKEFGKNLANITGRVLFGAQLFAKAATPETDRDDRFIGKARNYLAEIEGLVTVIQVVREKVGMEGTAAAASIAPLVANELTHYFELSGRKLDDDKKAEFEAACAKLGGALADALNCLK